MQKKFNHVITEINLPDIDSETTEQGRHYSNKKGIRLPSVTTVTGWEKNKFFAKWRADNPKEAKRVTRRGNVLHSIIEDYLNNKEINLSSIPPNECDLFIQIKPELDKIDNIHALEVALWSTRVGLAGRVDCIAEYNGELSIIDFKGSTRDKREEHVENYMLQATAYCLMWEDMTGNKIDKFKILISCETGKIQVFPGKPIKWVKKLFNSIENYKENH